MRAERQPLEREDRVCIPGTLAEGSRDRGRVADRVHPSREPAAERRVQRSDTAVGLLGRSRRQLDRAQSPFRGNGDLEGEHDDQAESPEGQDDHRCDDHSWHVAGALGLGQPIELPRHRDAHDGQQPRQSPSLPVNSVP